MVRTVRIRGSGLVTALGAGVRANADALLSGAVGFRELRGHPWTPGVHRAAEVTCPVSEEARGFWILETAIAEALSGAGIASDKLSRAGVFVGTTSGFLECDDIRQWREISANPSAEGTIRARGIGWTASHAASVIGTSGPVMTFSAACASSAVATVEALRWIRSGRLDVAVVVGFEGLLSATLSGFKTMMLSDADTCRPFDRRRAGTMVGEGCGVLVLSAEGAGPIIRSGSTRLDPTSATSHASDGSAGELLLRDVLNDGGLSAGDVAAIKIHGTGTTDNDLIESRVLRRVFGAGRIPLLSGLKGALGHTLGASGTLEMAAWMECVRTGFVPPTAGFGERDPDLDVEPLRLPTAVPRGVHLHEFFGFGGSCAALAIEPSGGNP